jgi:hypothetical protein
MPSVKLLRWRPDHPTFPPEIGELFLNPDNYFTANFFIQFKIIINKFSEKQGTVTKSFITLGWRNLVGSLTVAV